MVSAHFIAAAFAALYSSTVLAAPAASNHTLVERATHSGRATFFYVGLGNCGQYNQDSDHIVALSSGRYSGGGFCDRYVSITNPSNGQQVYAQVRDSCPPCGYDDLDLSPSAFDAIGNRDDGQYQVDWNFMPDGWSP